MSRGPERDHGPSALAARLAALADRLERSRGPVVLVAEDLQVHADALADLTDDPRQTTAALVSRAGVSSDVRATGPADVRMRAGRLAAASSPVHRVASPDAAFTGALRVADADRVVAAAGARAAAELARAAGWRGDPVDYLLVALVRAEVPVTAVTTDPWPWRRGAGGTQHVDFRAELDQLGPERSHALRLARAGKAEDGAWATVVSRPLSRRLTPLALRLGLTPNQVTLASFVVGLTAAACFATGDRVLLVVGALLLQLSLVVDCVDGDVARYTRSFSATGAWLDASTDRLKEFACYGGLAWGAGAGAEGWLLAAAMLTLQTVRHTVDYTFTAVKELREADAEVQPPLAEPADRTAVGGSASARAVTASERSNRRPAVKWAKRGLHLSIGERWAVLSVLAAAGRPVLALGVLLGLGLVSFAYTAAGRTLRARSWARGEPSLREREIVAAQVDAGPLLPGAGVRVAGSAASQFRWARPAVLRLLEYSAVLVLVRALATDATPAAFALLLVTASHHYDDLYRVLHRLAPAAAGLRALGLGMAGRLLLLAVLAVLGERVLEGGLWVLAAWLGILFVVVEPVRVLREVRSG